MVVSMNMEITSSSTVCAHNCVMFIDRNDEKLNSETTPVCFVTLYECNYCSVSIVYHNCRDENESAGRSLMS